MIASVQQLKSRIGDLKAQVRNLEQQLHEAEIAESSVKVGQIYTRVKRRFARPDKIERGQVTGFRRRRRFGGATVAVLTLFKSDGTLGKRQSEIDDYSGWELENS